MLLRSARARSIFPVALGMPTSRLSLSPALLGSCKPASSLRLPPIYLRSHKRARACSRRRLPFDATASGYRVALANVGLMRSAMKVDQRALRAEFEAYYSRTLALLPGVVGDDGHCGAWLESIVRTQRHAFQPLHHLLLQRFLGERAAVRPAFRARAPGVAKIRLHRITVATWCRRQMLVATVTP